MFDIDRWNEIWSALTKNKVRSLLTAFGVFWGVFMLIVMAGAGNGLENGIVEGVSRFATNSAFLWTNTTSEAYKGFKRGRNWNMESEDVEYLKNNVAELEYITPKNFGSRSNSGPNVVRDRKNGTFNIKGDYPDYVKIDPCTVLKGRWINEVDIRERRKVCVIGERVAESLFNASEDPIGQHLKISGVYYQVVGVIRPETRVSVNGRTEESVSIPFTTMSNWQQGFLTNGSVTDMYVGVSAYRDLMFLTKVTNGSQVVGYNVTLSFCEMPNSYPNYPALISNDRPLVNFQAPNGITINTATSCGYGLIAAALNTVIVSQRSTTNPYTSDFPVYTSFTKPTCNGQY